MPHYILGITAFSHDSAACLLRDGEVIYFIEEERLNREKHTSEFPYLAIQSCLDFAGIKASDIQDLSFFMKPNLEITANLSHFLRYFPATLALFRSKAGGGANLNLLGRNWSCRQIGKLFAKKFNLSSPPRVHFIEHHLAHASSCFHLSEFEEAAILTLDGRGEATTTLLAHGRGTKIQKLMEQKVPHSLGHLYAGITQHLGFKPFHDEWKVMGLSAYGTPNLVEKFQKIVKLENSGLFELDLSYLEFHTKGYPHFFSPRFFETFGSARTAKQPLEQRHYDLAYALQRVVENAGVHLAQTLFDKTRSPFLCLTGGVALNVLMNQKIMEQTPFQKIFIQPVASDAGTAMGAATYLWHSILNHPRKHRFHSAFLGSSYTESEIETALTAHGLKFERPTNLPKFIAEKISQGKVVGWFQGAMEVGPRALGHRSILADPRFAEMKDKINLMVKQRESFRPFAPSVLREHAQNYFKLPKGIDSPYMIMAAEADPQSSIFIEAVVHVDGTARVHTVDQQVDPLYWNLIYEFYEKTGIPMLLNTSFNQQEPIVRTPNEAIDCFLRARLDLLAIGSYVVNQPNTEI